MRRIHYVLIFEPSPRGYKNEVEIGTEPFEHGNPGRIYYNVSAASLRRLERAATCRWKMERLSTDLGETYPHRLYAPSSVFASMGIRGSAE